MKLNVQRTCRAIIFLIKAIVLLPSPSGRCLRSLVFALGGILRSVVEIPIIVMIRKRTQGRKKKAGSEKTYALCRKGDV